MKVHWLVTRVTRTSEGKSVDDGAISVSLVAAGAVSTILHVGHGVGTCTTHPSFPRADVCEDPSSEPVTRVVCGGDPHVARIICYDAMRTDDGLRLTRREFDVPGRKTTLLGSGSVGEIRVPPTARVTYSPTDEYQEIEEPHTPR